jgi:hypothetical protein
MTTGQQHDASLPRVDGFYIALGTPRKLPKADRLPGRVVVLDIAFASESGGRKKAFEHTTKRFIDKLGERLAAWVDHHDSHHHALYSDDPRFTLATKAQHGACPEMVTPALIARAGAVDTIVCHVDFDGLASAAKWMLNGEEPYPGCDDDARAIDTRSGLPGPIGARFDSALRARPRSAELQLAVLEQLAARLGRQDGWALTDEAGGELAPREACARQQAARYRRLTDELVAVEVDRRDYDRTMLLLLGQARAKIALVVDGDNATFAAAYDSGVDFLSRFGLSSGMPTLVSIHRPRLAEALVALGVAPDVAKSVQIGSVQGRDEP